MSLREWFRDWFPEPMLADVARAFAKVPDARIQRNAEALKAKQATEKEYRQMAEANQLTVNQIYAIREKRDRLEREKDEAPKNPRVLQMRVGSVRS